MTDRLEEVYEKYVKPLPPGERLRLLGMTEYSGTTWIRQRNLARDRGSNLCRWSS